METKQPKIGEWWLTKQERRAVEILRFPGHGMVTVRTVDNDFWNKRTESLILRIEPLDDMFIDPPTLDVSED